VDDFENKINTDPIAGKRIKEEIIGKVINL